MDDSTKKLILGRDRGGRNQDAREMAWSVLAQYRAMQRWITEAKDPETDTPMVDHITKEMLESVPPDLGPEVKQIFDKLYRKRVEQAHSRISTLRREIQEEKDKTQAKEEELAELEASRDKGLDLTPFP